MHDLSFLDFLGTRLTGPGTEIREGLFEKILLKATGKTQQ
jgi:hypothetical protein